MASAVGQVMLLRDTLPLTFIDPNTQSFVLELKTWPASPFNSYVRSGIAEERLQATLVVV